MIDDIYQKKYLKYKKKYLDLTKFNNQSAGFYDNFENIKNRIEQKPDNILIYTTQLILELPTTKQYIDFYNSNEKVSISEEVFSEIKLDPIGSSEIFDFSKLKIFDGKNEFLQINENILISNIESYITDLDNDTIRKKPKVPEKYIKIRNSSQEGFYTLEIVQNNRRVLQIRFKIETKEVILSPFEPDGKRNTEFFEKYNSTQMTGKPGDSARILQNKFIQDYPDLRGKINILYSRDSEQLKKYEFSKLTSNSNLFIVGHCCRQNSISGNLNPININELKSLLKIDNLLICLWACEANIKLMPNLMKEFPNSILISSKTIVTRLGTVDSSKRLEIVEEALCGKNPNWFVTIWDHLHNEPLNFRLGYLGLSSFIESQYIELRLK